MNGEKAIQGSFEYERTSDGIRLTNYIGADPVVNIPSEIEGVPVRILGSHAFFERGLEVERILVPDSVRVIEPYACEFCLSLQELRLGNGVEVLGRAFLAVSQQEVLYVPASVKEIEAPDELGMRLFIDPENPVYYSRDDVLYKRLPGGGISLEATQCCAEHFPEPSEGAADLPAADELTEEPEESDRRDLRSEFCVPEGVTRIAEHALDKEERLRAIELPSSLRELAEGVLTCMNNPFAEGGISDIKVAADNPVFFIEDDALLCRLSDGGLKLVRYLGEKRELFLSNEITEIASGAFFYSKVRRIRIPDSVKKIHPGAFVECALEEAFFSDQMIYFPAIHPWMHKNVVAGFGENGKRYDISFYDEALKDPSLNAEKVRMMFTRLKFPQELTPELEMTYRQRISTEILKVTELFARQNDVQGIRVLGELGFLTKENVDAVIEVLNHAKMQEMLYAVMEYKHEHLENEEYDFVL